MPKLENLHAFFNHTDFKNSSGIFKTYSFTSSNSAESPAYPIGVYLISSSHMGITSQSFAGVCSFGHYEPENTWRDVPSLSPEFNTGNYNLQYNQYLGKIRNTTQNNRSYYLIKIA